MSTKLEERIAAAILAILAELPQRGDTMTTTLSAQNISGRVRRRISTGAVEHNACTAVLFALVEEGKVNKQIGIKVPARFSITKKGRSCLSAPTASTGSTTPPPLEDATPLLAPNPDDNEERNRRSLNEAIDRMADQLLRNTQASDEQLSLLP